MFFRSGTGPAGSTGTPVIAYGFWATTTEMTAWFSIEKTCLSNMLMTARGSSR